MDWPMAPILAGGVQVTVQVCVRLDGRSEVHTQYTRPPRSIDV